jgi:cell division transport system ATP-binding protein
MENILQVENLSKKFDSHAYSLESVSFSVPKGEMMFVTGPSGAGKSTLLKLLALLVRPSSGEIWFNGIQVSNLPNKKIPMFRRMMGIIFQEPMLLADRNVFNNVALPLVIDNHDYKDMGRKVRAALDKVSLLNKEKMYPHQLSAGEQQRVSIARAIVNKPLLVLADEPTGNLDPSLSMEIFNLFNQLSNVGVSSLITTHDQYLIEQLPQKKLILRQDHKLEIPI